MKQNTVSSLQFRADIEFVSESSACFKPDSFPPSNDFAMSIDIEGKVISKYEDDIWNFKMFDQNAQIYFSAYDENNKSLFKQIMFYIIYSNMFLGRYISLLSPYSILQYVFRICSANRISAAELRRYPKVIEEIANKIPKSKFNRSVSLFNQLLNNSEHIGFVLYDKKSLALHSKFNPNYESGQNAYIPPRIWNNLIHSLDATLDEFNQNKANIEKAYHYVAKTFLLNEKQMRVKTKCSPFDAQQRKNKSHYGASFATFAKDYGIYDWILKCVKNNSRSGNIELIQFSSALNSIIFTCYLYVLFYSIMRKNETLSLRTDCLKIETDERLGKIYMLVGETTKTDPDSDARWIVSNRVEKAIEIAKTILEWKLNYVQENTKNEKTYLFQLVDVWTKASRPLAKREIVCAANAIKALPKLFNLKELTITQEDYQLALAITPTIEREEWFYVGNFWRFGFHQFRRTLAIMFAINNISSATSQFQMKHGTREQQFHYMNNYTKLKFNSLTSELIIAEFYNEMARNINEIADINSEKISPHFKTPISNEFVNLLSENEVSQLLKAAKEGKISFRKNLLGGCMKQGSCEFGGIDSISKCSGGHKGNMCIDLIIDCGKEQEFIDDMAHYKERMANLPEDSPIYNSFKAEVQGYKNVLKVIKDKKSS